MKFLNHTQNSLQIIVFQTQFFMTLTKNTTKPFPEIPGNRETIPGNETPDISREIPGKFQEFHSWEWFLYSQEFPGKV